MGYRKSLAHGVIATMLLSAVAAEITGCGGDGMGSSTAAGFSPGLNHTGADAGGSGSGMGGSSTTNLYTVSATVAGLSGQGLVLELNGGQDQAVAADGTVIFPNGLADGSSYAVTVTSQPGVRREICGITNGSGTITQANATNIAVNCSVVVGFLYQAQTVYGPVSPGGPGQLLSYGMSTGTGALVPFGTALATDPYPSAIAVSPGGSFLILSTGSNGSDQSSGTISVYAVNSDTGALNPVSFVITTGLNPSKMVLSPSGILFVFGTNPGAPGLPAVSASLEAYMLDASSGTLTPAGTPLTFSPQSATNLAATPDGQFLYVLNGDFGSNTPAPVSLTAYAINSTTGALTAGPALTWMTTWNNTTNPGGTIAIDPLGRFLYLASNQGNPTQAAATILPYAIDANSGALTAIGTGTPVVTDAAALAADPTGRYLYALNALNSNAANDTVLALGADQSSGVISVLGAPLQTQGQPFEILCDPSGQFVYVGTIAGTTTTDLGAYAISTATATAGQLLSSGQSGSSSAETQALAIVE